jgi:Mlc titration factor MtfA (ptsG expression regulator)
VSSVPPQVRFNGADTPSQSDPAKPPAETQGFFTRLKKRFKLVGWAAALTGAFAGLSYPYSYGKVYHESKLLLHTGDVKFTYMVPDGKGGFKEQWISWDLAWVKSDIAFRIAEVLQDRPELLKALRELPRGLEIRLYQADAIKKDEHGHTLGLARIHEDGRVSMSFATEVVKDNLRLSSETGHDVVAHELTHVLDYIRLLQDGRPQLVGADGFLPGWSDRQIQRYIKARGEELEKIRRWESPMDAYALENDKEFLAVLTETFFEKPQALKTSNAELYDLMADFYGLDPAASPVWSAIKQTATGDFSIDYIAKREPNGKLYMAGSAAVLLLGGGMLVWRCKKAAEAKREAGPTAEDILKDGFKLDDFFGK